MQRIPRTTTMMRLHAKRIAEVNSLHNEVNTLNKKIDKLERERTVLIQEKSNAWFEAFKKAGVYDKFMKRDKKD